MSDLLDFGGALERAVEKYGPLSLLTVTSVLSGSEYMVAYALCGNRVINGSFLYKCVPATSQAVRFDRDAFSPARVHRHAKTFAERAGGKIYAWYLTMGRYDAVLITEFPSDDAGATFTLSIGALGNVTTETLKAFTESEYRKIIAGLS